MTQRFQRWDGFEGLVPGVRENPGLGYGSLSGFREWGGTLNIEYPMSNFQGKSRTGIGRVKSVVRRFCGLMFFE